MRLAILSDVHANLEALEAVMAEIARLNVDEIVCLGDVVGYGPDPVPVLDLIRDACSFVVRGNHDEAVATLDGIDLLPSDGQVAAHEHHKALTQEHRAWLAGLPLVASGGGVTLAHAAPLDPGLWPRLDSFRTAQEQFGAFKTPVCFVGHSHRPAIVSDKLGVFKVKPGSRFLVNPGAVGQPRDGDPRAAFGVFDTETMAYELHRVEYDAARTAHKIREAGLPEELGQRLLRGE